MGPAELRDTGDAAGVAFAEIADLVRDVHRAVSARVFTLTGRLGRPVRLVHDAVSAIAFGSSRLGLRTIPVVATAVAASTRREPTDLPDAVRAHLVLGAVNGWAGDRLAAAHSKIALPMTMRTHAGSLRRAPADLVQDVDRIVSERLAIFVHGLCETDRSWRFGAAKHYRDPSVTYGSLLRDQEGWTPLYVNYNSGLHISDNGREFAQWLESVVEGWPVPLSQIAIVGHSMGGLVARSAAHQGAASGHGWVPALRHIVGLGVPHTGAPLERFTNAGTHALAGLPETRPFATYLNRRSVGIKDLRFGSISEQDWAGFDPDERLVDRSTPTEVLPGVAYSMMSATLSRHPSGRFAHDVMVQHASAHGIRRFAVETAQLGHVGGKHHLSLLGDPLVYEQLRRWLGGTDGAAPPIAARPEGSAGRRRHLGR